MNNTVSIEEIMKNQEEINLNFRAEYNTWVNPGNVPNSRQFEGYFFHDEDFGVFGSVRFGLDGQPNYFIKSVYACAGVLVTPTKTKTIQEAFEAVAEFVGADKITVIDNG